MVYAAKSYLLAGLFLAAVAPVLDAQVAVSAIDQSRLWQPPPAAPIPAVDTNGNAVGETTDVADDSFGAQMILKDQERVRPFTLSGGSSIYYTSNVALTRRDTRDDTFARRRHPTWRYSASHMRRFCSIPSRKRWVWDAKTADLGCPSSTTGTLNAKIGQPNGLTDRRNFGKCAGKRSSAAHVRLDAVVRLLAAGVGLLLVALFRRHKGVEDSRVGDGPGTAARTDEV